ncbi:hypothetical protein HDU89_003665 [Geranomyces variabilis]|nr:hypothetical protein HDU89_003665 [Geranomyces variabilis]
MGSNSNGRERTSKTFPDYVRVNVFDADNDSSPPQGGTKQKAHLVPLSIAFYMVTSIVMLVANKMVLLRVALPATFLWIQLIIAVGIMQVGHFLNWFAIPTVNIATCKKLRPVVALNVVGLTLNTYTIQMGDASFYQIARGLILPLTVVLSWMFLERPSGKALGACAVVTGAYLCGTLGESESVNISTGAVTFGVLSSITAAGQAIVVKKAMGSIGDGGNTIDIVYYNNLLSAACFPVVMLVTGEAVACLRYARQMLQADASAPFDYGIARTFTFGCLVTGVLGFLLNVAGFLQIKVTSPLTHVVSSAARGVLQTVVAAVLFNETVTSVRATSLVGITLGNLPLKDPKLDINGFVVSGAGLGARVAESGIIAGHRRLSQDIPQRVPTTNELISCKVGHFCTLHIQSHDFQGKPHNHNSAKFKARLFGTAIVAAIVTSDGNGRYTATYTARDPEQYLVQVYLSTMEGEEKFPDLLNTDPIPYFVNEIIYESEHLLHIAATAGEENRDFAPPPTRMVGGC